MKFTVDKSLSAAFNRVSRRAPVELEAQFNLVGIAGKYVFPEGQSANDFENLNIWLFSGELGGGFKTRPPILLNYPELPENHLRDAQGAGLQFINNTSSGYQQIVWDTWAAVVALNPVLKKLQPQTPAEAYECTFGATSGFNVDDIAFYQKLGRKDIAAPGHASLETPQITALREKVAKALNGQELYWVASAPTMKKILKQVQARKP